MNTVTDIEPLMTRMQVAEMVATHYNVSVPHASKRIMMLPGFPDPACATPSANGSGRARWKREHIVEWILQQERKAA